MERKLRVGSVAFRKFRATILKYKAKNNGQIKWKFQQILAKLYKKQIHEIKILQEKLKKKND